MWRALNKIGVFLKPLPALCKTSRHSHNFKNNVKENLPVVCKLVENYLPACYFKKKFNGEKKEHGRAKSNGSFNIRHDWLEAFGWSGIVILSWHIWFPCFRGRFSPNPAERYAYESLPSCFVQECKPLVKYLSKFVLDSPVKYVLPEVSATKSKPATPVDDSEFVRRGCEALETAHETVKSSLINWLGTESMQQGRHEEAFGYFTEAAASNHTAAIFNLGICYEMGLGTAQCFKQAAELYKKAAKLGHATAMYNLGVFHVHGWGGLEADGNEAHELFVAAAKLGQIDAKKALYYDEAKSSSEESESDIEDDTSSLECQPFFQDIVEPKNNDGTDLWLDALNIKLTNIKSAAVKIPKTGWSSVDSGINDLSPPDNLQICS